MDPPFPGGESIPDPFLDQPFPPWLTWRVSSCLPDTPTLWSQHFWRLKPTPFLLIHRSPVLFLISSSSFCPDFWNICFPSSCPPCHFFHHCFLHSFPITCLGPLVIPNRPFALSSPGPDSILPASPCAIRLPVYDPVGFYTLVKSHGPSSFLVSLCLAPSLISIAEQKNQ